MSHSTDAANARRDEIAPALFATLILQQANMALVMLGKAPGPDGKTMPADIQAAGMFIDLLEMLETKTRGNLSPDEHKLLQQNLAAVRMAFVETLETQMHGSHPPAQETSAPAASPPPPPDAPAGEESRKRFSKKY